MAVRKMVQFALSILASLVATLVVALVDAELPRPEPSLGHQRKDATAVCAGWKAPTQETLPPPTIVRANSNPS